MATILASWELGRGYGHLAALAPVARALKAIGHRVVLAAKEPETALKAPGDPFDAVVAAPLAALPPPESTLTYAAVVRDAGLGDAGETERLARDWLALFAAHRADALLSEHAPLSLLAAHAAGLPAARLGIGFTAPPPMRPFASLQPWTRADEAARRASDAPVDAVVKAVCAALGAPPLDGLAGLLETAPTFLATWPEMDIHGAREGATYYGPMGGYGGQARPLWPGGVGPKVFVYLSVGHRLAEPLARALGALRWPTLWHSAEPPVRIPPTIRYSAEPVDIAYVLESAALQVGRAGHSSLCDGLAFGRPQLMLPDTLETLLLAGRVAHQGLGRLAIEDVDEAGFATLLRATASDAGIAAATARFRKRYAVYDAEAAAGEMAADLVAAWGV